MAKNLLLLGAMIATDTITFDQAKQWVEFCDESDAQRIAPATLEVAVDMALSYFRADPDTEAAKEAAKIHASHEAPACDAGRGVCPDCGEPSPMDEADYEQAIDLWMAVRMVCDKYAFDQAYSGGPDQDEC